MNNNTIFGWAVRIDSKLRAPVTLYSINQNIEIREFVTDAVKEKLEKISAEAMK
jgi:hypothetical protein